MRPLSLFILFFIGAELAFANLDCAVTGRVQEAAAKGILDDSFWRNYSRLNLNTKDGQRSLAKLVNRYDKKKEISLDRRQNANNKTADRLHVDRRRPQMTKTALKDQQKLPVDLRERYASFFNEATNHPDGHIFYSQPKKWHFEKLPQYGKAAHSIRLNRGYRVLFDIEDKLITIRGISKQIGH